jgi:Ca2+-binding RTX toxin-like protein
MAESFSWFNGSNVHCLFSFSSAIFALCLFCSICVLNRGCADADLMTGGAGADKLLLNLGSNQPAAIIDRIADFDVAACGHLTTGNHFVNTT